MILLAVKLSDTVSAALCGIAGEYGNGTERTNKLKKVGYNPQKVQACVNELLKLFEKYK